MLPVLALALFQQENAPFAEEKIPGVLGPRNLLVRTQSTRLSEPKISPKQGWQFDWLVGAFAGNASEAHLRFSVFSQESTQGSARAASVARTLLRLYGYNVARLGLDHADEFNGIVSVYLCYGGDPGGEQLFDVEKEPKYAGNKVNTIYFYDLKSLTDPVETVREVVHEYGHATLPPVGGFTEPENWANGRLGEKLYMAYLADARKAGTLGPEDTFGATPAALGAWVRKNVDPLVQEAALKGPQAWGKDAAGMDAFLGLALWMGRLYNPSHMVRALTFSMDPNEFAASAVTVAEESTLTTINVPADLAGKAIWVPLGDKGRVSGADEIGKRKAGWAHLQLRPGVSPVLTQPKP